MGAFPNRSVFPFPLPIPRSQMSRHTRARTCRRDQWVLPGLSAPWPGSREDGSRSGRGCVYNTVRFVTAPPCGLPHAPPPHTGNNAFWRHTRPLYLQREGYFRTLDLQQSDRLLREFLEAYASLQFSLWKTVRMILQGQQTPRGLPKNQINLFVCEIANAVLCWEKNLPVVTRTKTALSFVLLESIVTPITHIVVFWPSGHCLCSTCQKVKLSFYRLIKLTQLVAFGRIAEYLQPQMGICFSTYVNWWTIEPVVCPRKTSRQSRKSL